MSEWINFMVWAEEKGEQTAKEATYYSSKDAAEMGATLGLGQTGGNKLLHFLEGQKVAPHVGPELRAKLANPLVFKCGSSAPNAPPPVVVHGYDVTILIDVVSPETATTRGPRNRLTSQHTMCYERDVRVEHRSGSGSPGGRPE